MKESKFIICSIFLHALLFSSIIFDWKSNEKQVYMDSDVLLMGPKTGDKINPQTKPKSKEKSVQAPVANDPNAVKTYDKNAPDATEQSEGTFGQGGTKELDYNTELVAWIKANKHYPKMARRLGQECENIVVDFTLHPDGKIENIVLKEKCEFEILNQAAIDSVKAANPFKPFPPNFPNKPIAKSQPFSYNLTE